MFYIPKSQQNKRFKAVVNCSPTRFKRQGAGETLLEAPTSPPEVHLYPAGSPEDMSPWKRILCFFWRGGRGNSIIFRFQGNFWGGNKFCSAISDELYQIVDGMIFLKFGAIALRVDVLRYARSCVFNRKMSLNQSIT